MRTTSLKGAAATSSLAFVFQQSNQPLEPFVRPALDFGRVASRPVVKALSAPNAEIAPSDHVLEIRRRDAGVRQRWNNRSLRLRVNFETCNILLLEQSGHAHARPQEPLGNVVDHFRRLDPLYKEMIRFVQDGVLQSID